MNIVEEFKDIVKQKAVILKYRRKCREFSISSQSLEYLSNRTNVKGVSEILNIIDKSKSKEDFINKIINYLKDNNNILSIPLLIGCLTGNYHLFLNLTGEKIKNIDNFRPENREKVLKILKAHLYDYVINNNHIKNIFHFKNNNIANLTEDVTANFVETIFDYTIENKTVDKKYMSMVEAIQEYIYTVLNNYELDDILNNFDFIEYHMAKNLNGEIETEKIKYEEYKDLGQQRIFKIENIDILKNRLQYINNNEAKLLLQRLEKIKNPKDSIEELEDIYSEYEILFRQDIINHLYVPREKETIITDFRDTKPLLIHSFIRNPQKFREALEKRIKEKIISERKTNNESSELTEEEQETYNKLLQRLEVELNQTQVNYSYESNVGMYSDRDGFNYYQSDTTNQIATSIYSEKFFWDNTREMIGIGFDEEGLLPEAIALSSPSYLTTNKGINNLEYDTNEEFNLMSANYSDLVKNDGNSEVVLFRRNMDYDTKASYIFVAVDDNIDLIEQARALAKENNMKLVIYDIKKIRESYKKFNINNSEETIENQDVKRR